MKFDRREFLVRLAASTTAITAPVPFDTLLISAPHKIFFEGPVFSAPLDLKTMTDEWLEQVEVYCVGEPYPWIADVVSIDEFEELLAIEYWPTGMTFRLIPQGDDDCAVQLVAINAGQNLPNAPVIAAMAYAARFEVRDFCLWTGSDNEPFIRFVGADAGERAGRT